MKACDGSDDCVEPSGFLGLSIFWDLCFRPQLKTFLPYKFSLSAVSLPTRREDRYYVTDSSWGLYKVSVTSVQFLLHRWN
jgi:hypothetical protein